MRELSIWLLTPSSPHRIEFMRWYAHFNQTWGEHAEILKYIPCVLLVDIFALYIYNFLQLNVRSFVFFTNLQLICECSLDCVIQRRGRVDRDQVQTQKTFFFLRRFHNFLFANDTHEIFRLNSVFNASIKTFLVPMTNSYTQQTQGTLIRDAKTWPRPILSAFLLDIFLYIHFLCHKTDAFG